MPSLNPVIPYEPNWDDDTEDFDLLQILNEMDTEAQRVLAVPKSNSTTTTSTSAVSENYVQQHNSPMFAGCKMANIDCMHPYWITFANQYFELQAL